MNNNELPDISLRYTTPFSVGISVERYVMDSRGLVVVIFPKGFERWAADYCVYLNEKYLCSST